jgi:hypothetical protein
MFIGDRGLALGGVPTDGDWYGAGEGDTKPAPSISNMRESPEGAFRFVGFHDSTSGPDWKEAGIFRVLWIRGCCSIEATSPSEPRKAEKSTLSVSRSLKSSVVRA